MIHPYNRKMLITLLAAFSGLSYAGYPTPIELKKRCDIQDSLTPFEALGRNDWSLRCKRLSPRTYDFNVNDDYGNRRTLPYYPTYSKSGNFADWIAAPRVKMASCDNHGYNQMYHCRSISHFDSAQLLFAPGELTVYDAYTQQVQQLVIVDERATLDDLYYREETVSITAKKAPVQQVDVITIHTQSGKTLRVTQDHPLLLAEGILKNAQYLSTQDTLIAQNGELDNITSITTSTIAAQRYNTQLNTLDAEHQGKSHIVITQGFLSGYLADNGELEMGQRLAMRDTLPLSLID
ncbi:hypothetical protein A7985_13270 [Pseudoalteromonas luteoviolacea]|uniref:Hint domain-containing protein n=1 Tax=Pseudoalteromonas luteoviolacea TaxID=43657 RepID=A0A1C0TPV3_9GAMM|nr:hypothetical protein [Pseudoalteromonas luteoviolacea]OCQ20768.1 hypothetical protein A7985_13270 [Pseudoalteromonas luteoviolacea]